MKNLLKTMAGVSLLFVLSVNAFAQTGNGALTGTVEDPTKALIPGVTITATNTQTGVATAVLSNESGGYNIPGLLPGIYQLTAELAGFRTVTFNNIELGTNETKRYNFTLEVAAQATSVDVIDAAGLLTTSSATIDQVLPEYRVRDLPLVGGDVLDLIGVLGGARVSAAGGNFTTFAGISAAYVNTTVNGQSVQDGRYAAGIYSTTRINPDLVSEVRLVLTPVDAELGRGNGQVQIQTRSGTNQFRGSAVWDARNSALDARSWFDNRTVPLPPRTWTNQHQYTLSYGGPIVKNKTFFFVLYDGQRTRLRQSVNASVLTPCARNGVFRYFPDWNNGNINQNPTATPTALGTASRPVVDAAGNPVAPATFRNGAPYTGTLQYISVFGRVLNTPTRPDCSDAQIAPNTAWDSNRTTADATGFIKKVMSLMPQPNSYDTGDGLNTAGYRWARGRKGDDEVSGGTADTTDRAQINVRIDHNFNSRHKLGANLSYERDDVDNSGPDWPGGYWGAIQRRPYVLTSNFISTLSSTLVNEARFGVRYNDGKQYEPLDHPKTGKEAREFYPTINGLPVVVAPSLFGSSVAVSNDFTRGNLTSLATYADTLSWTKGQHAYRFGGEFRVARSDGWSNLNFLPHANGGAGGGSVPFPVFTNILGAISGAPAGTGNMLTTSSTAMGNLLSFLSGAIGSVNQLYFLKSADRLDKYEDLRTADQRGTIIRQNEWSAFLKDDWKVHRNLTLNLGLRYEYYGSPWEANGLTVSPVGGGLAAFGYSGRSFEDWFRPGQRGDITTFEFIGPNSPNPDKSLVPADRNNFGPAIGFAWQPPWFGQGKTTVRGGYQLTYQGGGRSLNLDIDLGYAPGMIFTPNLQAADNTFISLADIYNPAKCGGPGCIPVPHNLKPMQPIPNEYRATIAGWQGLVYDPNYATPYIQNFTMAVTRSVGQNMTMDVRYIGTRGMKLFDTLPLNSRNFLTNGLKEAFDAARYGRESELLDRMFNGINIAGAGYGPVGTVVNGVRQTGAMHLRAFTTTQNNLANGNYSGLAGTLNTLNYNRNLAGNASLPVIPTSHQGAVLRYNGFPENFISANPQFNTVGLRTNGTNSIYHAMQAQFTLRPTAGFNYQGTFTWGRSMGSPPNGGYQDPTDRREYGLTFGHRLYDFRSNGGFELPFGPNKLLLGNSSGWLARLVEQWKATMIFQMTSGRPNTITAAQMLFQGTGTPVVTPEGVAAFGPFPSKFGSLNWPDGALAGSYFPSDMFSRVPDPQCANVTGLQNLNGLNAAAPTQRCTLQALARRTPDGQQVIVLRNPLPGERGTLALNTMEGLGLWFLDAAMSKSFKISETKSLQFRVDARNLLNHPTPDDPGLASCFGGGLGTNLTLNSNNAFGTVGGKCVAESAARRFQASARFTF
ncbi:MAG: TonB-dependent receptor [Acidobacteria bacterium]|nr:TonB-dependent receptor [Acidobacteriota bacterium]